MGRQAAVCLDSIHDPSVCHRHGNSQRQQQDGKLHYHRNYVPFPSLRVLSLCSSSPSFSVYPPSCCCLALSTFPTPFSLSSPSESVCTIFNPPPVFFLAVSLFLSLSLNFHPSFSPSASLRHQQKKMHSLRKLQSLWSFPIMLVADTYIKIHPRQLNILSTQLRILSIGNEPPNNCPLPLLHPASKRRKKGSLLVPCGVVEM